MEKFHSSYIRNFTMVGHNSCKTFFSEAFLKLGSKINRLGPIEEGAAASDYHSVEKARKTPIHSIPIYNDWSNKKTNIIDTAGYSDFISESMGSLTSSRGVRSEFFRRYEKMLKELEKKVIQSRRTKEDE